MFRILAIANRGEIARRILRTARRMGLSVVSLHSGEDAGALFVREADRALRIESGGAKNPYLDIKEIVGAAQRAGAEAIHPGYGFLSESAEFARACQKAGLIFVGPGPETLERMGSKTEARDLMERAGIPVIPGFTGEGEDDRVFGEAAAKIGFPVLVKAAGGGGGRGMRIVHGPDELPEALASARREAKGAFADTRLFLEKYLDRARHIEVQIFGDTHGTRLHLGERDCSLQRRFQKLIEEAPAPGLAPVLRAQIVDAALVCAREADYIGAGTVEFLVQNDDFYFIEMNPRLQVEHPVTEEVTGLDLVEWQLRVAAGESLPLGQEEIKWTGHAIELRINAEDPAQGFLPSIGRIDSLRWPADLNTLRIDTGVRQGDIVSPHYDNLLAKIIAHAPSRDQARRALLQGLQEIRITGIRANPGLLVQILRDEDFRAGGFDTGIMARKQAQWTGMPEMPEEYWPLAALAICLHYQKQGAVGAQGDPWSPWGALGPWLLNLPGEAVIELTLRQSETRCFRIREHEIILEGGASWRLTGAYLADGTVGAGLDGVGWHLSFVILDQEIRLFHENTVVALCFAEDEMMNIPDAGTAPSVTTPLPGILVAIRVKEGDRVGKGDTVAVLEAMKMEHGLCAPHDGIVVAIHVRQGERVDEGVEILTITEEESAMI